VPGAPVRPLPAAGADGSADPAVAAALEASGRRAATSAAVAAALARSRVLVPVVAVLDEAGTSPDGVAVDKTSHMAVVSTTGRDGRRGQLAFTGLASLRRWDPAARPVPVAVPAAAAAALAEGADALVVDLAGPVVFSVDAPALRRLAAGWRPVDDGAGTAWAVPVVAAEAREAGAGPPGDGPRRRSGVRRLLRGLLSGTRDR
jgi:hypothetical protein